MKMLSRALEISLVVGLTLWTTASCECKRSGGTNCATANGECSILYDKDTDTIISQLGWPPENIQTCYRTCFEEDICKTHFNRERDITRESNDPTQYTVQNIVSPQFQNGNGAYRTGTNCRFDLTCNEGQLLSYSATVFELQDQIDCSDQPVCVDWVNHLIGSLAQSHKVCGNGETGEIHSDGESSMQVEFVANRNYETTGFHYTVYCIAPGFDLNAVIQGVVPDTPVERRAAVQCTSPDSGREKRQSYYSPPPNAVPNIQPTIVLEMTHYLSFNDTTLNVHRGEYGVTSYPVEYLTVVTRFSRTTYSLWQPIDLEIRGYGYLWISNYTALYYKIGAHPVFDPSPEEKVIIHRLEVAFSQALGDALLYDVLDELDNISTPSPRPTPTPDYYGDPGPRAPTTSPPHTTGVPGVSDPPTATEPLEKGTRPPSTTLRPTGPPEPPGVPTTRPPRPTRPPGSVGPPGLRGRRSVTVPPGVTAQQRTLPPESGPGDESLTDAQLAMRYGNACNGILRAIACAYQHVVIKRNCFED